MSDINKLLQCVNVMKQQFDKVAKTPDHDQESEVFNEAYDVAYTLLIKAVETVRLRMAGIRQVPSRGQGQASVPY